MFSKTIEVNITWDEKGRDYFCGAICGWNLANTYEKSVGAEEGFGGDLSFYVDNKMTNEQLKRLFVESDIDFSKLTVNYCVTELGELGKEIKRCFSILEQLSAIEFIDYYISKDTLGVEIPFTEMDKFEIILKEFQIMG